MQSCRLCVPVPVRRRSVSTHDLPADVLTLRTESAAALGGPLFLQLREYVREGPFFVRTEPTVTAEGAA